MKILIAEDNPVTRALLKEILLSVPSWDVADAEDGKAAWDVLTSGFGAHLLISDIQMPNWDGLQLLRNIRGDERFRAMPAMLISSVKERDTIMEAAQLKIEAYVLKPFDAEKVIAQVKKIEEKLPPSARMSLLDDPKKTIERLQTNEEGYVKALDKFIADARAGAIEARSAVLTGNRTKARTRLDNVKGAALMFGANYLIEALEEAIKWVSDPHEVRDMSGPLEEIKRLESAAEEVKRNFASGAGLSLARQTQRVPTVGPAVVPVNPSAVAEMIIQEPEAVMTKLGIDGHRYLELFDLTIKDLDSGRGEIRKSVLKGDRETARTRLEAMKGGVLTFGAEQYHQAVLHTIGWILDPGQFGELDVLDMEHERLVAARQGIQLVQKASGNAPVVAPPAPAPAQAPTAVPAPAAPVSPTPPAVGATATHLGEVESLEEFKRYLPPEDWERLKWVLHVGAQHEYTLTPWQGIRLALRLAPTMTFTAESYYNILKEDYERRQKG